MPWRSKGLILASILLLATLPARVALMTQSVWLDEAWVANLIADGSLPDLLWGSTWVQSTPPLFMLMGRAITLVTGPAEWSVRLLPVVASAVSIFFLWPVLEEWFGRPLALLGTSLFAANYWAIKMGQQAKQYAGEMLIGTVLIWAILRLMTGKHRSPWLLTGLCCLATWSAAPTWFWLPSAGLAILLRTRSIASTATFAVLAGGSALANYWLFLRSAITPENSSNWKSSMLVSWPLVTGLGKLGQSVGQLILPAPGPLRYATWLLIGLAIVGCAREIRRSARGNESSRVILLTAVLPILGAIAASALGIFPVLDYPRVILWMLPGLTILIVAGINPLAGRLTEAFPRLTPIAVGTACVATVAAMYAGLLLFPRPTEHNRPAVASLARQAENDDVIYVHGGVSEAFIYYAHRLDWQPAVYLGNSGWPCCARDRQQRVSDPSLRRFGDEMRALAARAKGNRLWVYRPSARDSHWSGGIRAQLAEITLLGPAGCTAAVEENYDQVEVLAYDCR